MTETAAKKAAVPVLKALGQDDAKLDASELMGAVRVVNADPKVGGLPTYGWTTGVQVGPDGQVVGGNGQLKTPVEEERVFRDQREQDPGSDERQGLSRDAGRRARGTRRLRQCRTAEGP